MLLTIDIPDEVAATVAAAAARRQGRVPPVDIPAGQQAILDFLTDQLGLAVLDFTSQEAAVLARADETNPAVAWARQQRPVAVGGGPGAPTP